MLKRFLRVRSPGLRNLLAITLLGSFVAAGSAVGQTSLPPNQVDHFADTSMFKPPAGAKLAILEWQDLECPACAQAHASLQEVRAAIRDSSLYFQAPPGLARRVQSSVRRASRADRPPSVHPRRLLAVAASIALIVAAGWGLARGLLTARPDDAILTRELVADGLIEQRVGSGSRVVPQLRGGQPERGAGVP